MPEGTIVLRVPILVVAPGSTKESPGCRNTTSSPSRVIAGLDGRTVTFLSTTFIRASVPEVRTSV